MGWTAAPVELAENWDGTGKGMGGGRGQGQEGEMSSVHALMCHARTGDGRTSGEPTAKGFPCLKGTAENLHLLPLDILVSEEFCSVLPMSLCFTQTSREPLHRQAETRESLAHTSLM